jgi:hypothetical protein
MEVMTVMLILQHKKLTLDMTPVLQVIKYVKVATPLITNFVPTGWYLV